MGTVEGESRQSKKPCDKCIWGGNFHWKDELMQNHISYTMIKADSSTLRNRKNLLQPESLITVIGKTVIFSELFLKNKKNVEVVRLNLIIRISFRMMD